jgi:(2R)-3-sulfolactate dehydrogenase (NADP+)
MSKIDLEALEEVAIRALVAGNTSEANAGIVAAALVAADADGLASHGVSRVPFYADQAASRKVDGHATPVLEQPAAAAVRVDAADGFAYPAIRLGLDRAVDVAAEIGVATILKALPIANCWLWGSATRRRLSHRGAARGAASAPIPLAAPARAGDIRRLLWICH